MTTQQLQQRIGSIQAKLTALGAIHPGSLSEQYNVCGTPGCWCKDPKRPRKHGPYYQLSYTHRGKGHTEYVPQARRKTVEQQIANHRKFRKWMQEWIDLEIELCKLKLKWETQNSH